jgi:hypothetical protein
MTLRQIGNASVRAALYALVAVAAVGCACKGEMKRFNVQVTLDDPQMSTRTAPVEVDLVGASEIEAESLTNKSMTEYWNPQDPTQASLSKVHVELDRNRRTYTLQVKDKIWDTWKKQGVMKLFVLTSYPVNATDRPGNDDPRRRVIPLDCAWWDEGSNIPPKKTISVSVNPRGGLKVLTPPKPVPTK